MGEVKEINMKNRTYSYYFDDMIDIKKFSFSLIKNRKVVK